MKERITKRLDDRLTWSLDEIIREINSDKPDDGRLKRACYRLAASIELKEDIDKFMDDYVRERKEMVASAI